MEVKGKVGAGDGAGVEVELMLALEWIQVEQALLLNEGCSARVFMGVFSYTLKRDGKEWY
jgi:hypothetical protein